MTNVVDFTGLYYGHISPDKACKEAAKRKLKTVLIIGQDKDDNLFLSCSEAEIHYNVYMLERAKKFLMDQSSNNTLKEKPE